MIPKSVLMKVLTEYVITAWTINDLPYGEFLKKHVTHIKGEKRVERGLDPLPTHVTFKFFKGECETELDFKGCIPAVSDVQLIKEFNSSKGLHEKDIHLIKCMLSDLSISLKTSKITYEDDDIVVVELMSI